MIRLGSGESLLKAVRAFGCSVPLKERFQDFRTSHCGEGIGNAGVLQGTAGLQVGRVGPYVALTREYSLRSFLNNGARK